MCAASQKLFKQQCVVHAGWTWGCTCLCVVAVVRWGSAVGRNLPASATPNTTSHRGIGLQDAIRAHAYLIVDRIAI